MIGLVATKLGTACADDTNIEITMIEASRAALRYTIIVCLYGFNVLRRLDFKVVFPRTSFVFRFVRLVKFLD